MKCGHHKIYRMPQRLSFFQVHKPVIAVGGGQVYKHTYKHTYKRTKINNIFVLNATNNNNGEKCVVFHTAKRMIKFIVLFGWIGTVLVLVLMCVSVSGLI